MANNIDALIANFPGTLQENALNYAKQQLAQQSYAQNALKLQEQVQGRNALQGIYSDQSKWDPATGLPRTSAMAPLMQANPQQGLDFLEIGAKLNEERQRAMMLNLHTKEQWTGVFEQEIVQPLLKHDEGLPANISPEERERSNNAYREELIKGAIAKTGAPPDVAESWHNIPFDQSKIPIWGAQSVQWQNYQNALAKSWKPKTDPANGQEYYESDMRPGLRLKPDMKTPYEFSGLGKPVGHASAGKMMYVKNPDGTSTPEMVVQRDGKFFDQNNSPVEVAGEVPTSSPDYAGPQPKPSGDQNVTGEPYLAKLPRQEQNMVKALSEGRIAVPTWALRDPTWKQIIADTAQYDPSFDATNFNRRNKAYIEWTSGANGRSRLAINTALNHAAELWHSTDNLASHEWFKGEKGPISNWTEQTLKYYFKPSDPLTGAVNRFKTNADQLSAELEKATRGDRTAERGVEEWRSNFSKVQTPEQIKESIKEAWKLLAGRVDSMQEGLKAAIGPRANVVDLFTPFAKDTYRAFEEGKDPPDISGLVGQATGQQGAAQPGSAPSPASAPVPTALPDRFKNDPDDTVYRDKSDNRVYIKRGGMKVPAKQMPNGLWVPIETPTGSARAMYESGPPTTNAPAQPPNALSPTWTDPATGQRKVRDKFGNWVVAPGQGDQ